MTLSHADGAALVRRAAAAIERRQFNAARSDLDQLIAGGLVNRQVWLLLALAARGQGDLAGAEDAANRTIELDAGNIRALLVKGDVRFRAGDSRAATICYESARRLAEGQELPADVTAELEAAAAKARDAGAQSRTRMERFLASNGFPPEARSPRFQEAMAIVYGEKQVFHQQPTTFYFPQLPQRQYYEREEFDWIAGLEAETDAIREELSGLLTTREDFHPYLVSGPNKQRPGAHGLTDNPDWSTLHLWLDGAPVAANVARCPRTFAAMQRLPLAWMGTRGPAIMFSLLQPGARIPPHTGMLNTRLICHLPLTVPPGCRFRVGNEVREWEVGKTLIFDDTIEHEAWNDSGEDRVVLIFDIWRPELTPGERDAVQAMFGGVDAAAAANA